MFLTFAACREEKAAPALDAAPQTACIEGALACGDGGAVRCEGGALVLVNTCRGPAGCTGAARCDDSLAEEGDVCATPRQPACSVDRTAELFCEDGGYMKRRACSGPCEALDGAVLCK